MNSICTCRGVRQLRQYCPKCRQSRQPQRTPDKTVLFICYPKTVEQERKMQDSLKKFLHIKPVYVYSSKVPEALAIAKRIAEPVVEKDSLTKGFNVSDASIESLIPVPISTDLHIFVTHEAQTIRARQVYYSRFNSVSRPGLTYVFPGEIIVIDFTNRTVFKK